MSYNDFTIATRIVEDLEKNISPEKLKEAKSGYNPETAEIYVQFYLNAFTNPGWVKDLRIRFSIVPEFTGEQKGNGVFDRNTNMITIIVYVYSAKTKTHPTLSQKTYYLEQIKQKINEIITTRKSIIIHEVTHFLDEETNNFPEPYTKKYYLDEQETKAYVFQSVTNLLKKKSLVTVAKYTKITFLEILWKMTDKHVKSAYIDRQARKMFVKYALVAYDEIQEQALYGKD